MQKVKARSYLVQKSDWKPTDRGDCIISRANAVGNQRRWSKSKGIFTRSQRTASLTEYNKSALTDHAIQENHTIHWKEASVINREPDRPCTRWIKEAVDIRKEGHRSMNRDKGSYQLSHAYDHFLNVTVDRHTKIRKN